jgi:hypothetical protein
MDRLRILDSICARFASLGYQPVRSLLTYDRRDVWMRQTNDAGRSSFATMIYLQYKPSFKAYSIAFGVVDDDLMQQLRQLLELQAFRALLSNWQRARPIESPCWNLFDAGRALDWRYLSIPDLDAPEGWEVEFVRLHETLLDGVASKVVDNLTFARFLLKSDKPFEWWTSDSVLRAGEIILALMRQSYSVAAMVSELEEVREQIEPALSEGCDLPQFVRAISTYARQ